MAPFYNRASSLDHLSASIEATSLAFVAIQLHAPALRHLAELSYVNAIQKLGKAISELRTSGEEEALQSILLLDMYEKMVNSNPAGSSWMSHALGGLSLLGPRLHQFAASVTGRQLCGRLVTALTVSCGATATRVPDALTTLRGYLDPSMSTVKWRFTGLLSQVVDMQADFHNAGGICTANLADRAQQLDDQLRGLEGALPLSWQPRQISPIRPDPLVFGSHYAIYADHFVTQVTNGIRVARLMVNKILLTESSNSSLIDIPAQIRDITHHICATVPQFILPEALPENTLPFSPHQSLQCCLLLAPLYITHQVSTDNMMRDWILQCMGYMAETGGMRIARDVADLMRRNPNVDYWLVYAMVGSYAFAA
jgi:hypothetical protein